ncbi:MAG: hypothetical protein GC206_07600 [Alphaproteobacteria bacterium]|nr:hypothetical protein [Alphaproteobacteria bacterium]
MFGVGRDEWLLRGFQLGMRVMIHAFRLTESAGDAKKPWDVLEAIADGRLVMTPDLAEKVREHPEITRETMDRLLRDNAKSTERDREDAAHILRAFNERFR